MQRSKENTRGVTSSTKQIQCPSQSSRNPAQVVGPKWNCTLPSRKFSGNLKADCHCFLAWSLSFDEAWSLRLSMKPFPCAGSIPRVCSSLYQISFCPKFNLVMFKIEPNNLHEQFASDYLRLLKIYLKEKVIASASAVGKTVNFLVFG